MDGSRTVLIRLIATCWALVLLLAAPALAGCSHSAPGTTTVPGGETPVTGIADEPSGLGTTTTGSGPADLYISAAFAASHPKSSLRVGLFTESGAFIDGRDGVSSFAFKGLQPGRYRLGVFAGQTGYVSQWYGGLPVQGHEVYESRVLVVVPGRNLLDFVMQPGLSIQGQVTWSGGARHTGSIMAYDLQQRDTLRRATLLTTADGVSTRFLIVGLLRGRYKLGVSFNGGTTPQFWDGGNIFDAATVIDVTADLTGVDVDLGVVP